MIRRNEQTVHEWRLKFFQNDRTVVETKQGKYQHLGIHWSSEKLNKKATMFIRNNANVKGRPNLTVAAFC